MKGHIIKMCPFLFMIGPKYPLQLFRASLECFHSYDM